MTHAVRYVAVRLRTLVTGGETTDNTRTSLLWLAAAFACLVFAPHITSSQEAEPGRTVYVENGCHQCHGYDGQGGVAGPRVAPTPYPFEAFAALVRKPGNVMPAYAASVLDDDAFPTFCGCHPSIRLSLSSRTEPRSESNGLRPDCPQSIVAKYKDDRIPTTGDFSWASIK